MSINLQLYLLVLKKENDIFVYIFHISFLLILSIRNARDTFISDWFAIHIPTKWDREINISVFDTK